MTEEQAQFLLYSLYEKQMDYDFSVEDIGIAGYVGFCFNDSVEAAWDDLEQFSVERINANTWKVRAKDKRRCSAGKRRNI